MQRLEVSGAVRPIYGSLGVKRLRGGQAFVPGRGCEMSIRALEDTAKHISCCVAIFTMHLNLSDNCILHS